MDEHGTLFAVVTWVLPLILAITCHEVAHGFVARAFGDPTADRLGRLTLNPVAHVDPLGTLILPLGLAIAGAPVFGWAKPVPVNRSLLRNPRWHGLLVTAAGPLTNFVLAVVGAAALAGTLALTRGTDSFARDFALANLVNFVLVNLFLGTFNLLPVPPFDGGRIVAALLPPRIGRRYESFERYGMLLMILVLVVLPQVAPRFDIVGALVAPPVRWMLKGITGLFGL